MDELTSGNLDLIATEAQGVWVTHGINQCMGRPCCVHNPSDHHMRDWPVRFDRTMMAMAYRTCEHGRHHPDPDSLGYFAARLDVSDSLLACMAFHTCDGCCFS